MLAFAESRTTFPMQLVYVSFYLLVRNTQRLTLTAECVRRGGEDLAFEIGRNLPGWGRNQHTRDLAAAKRFIA